MYINGHNYVTNVKTLDFDEISRWLYKEFNISNASGVSIPLEEPSSVLKNDLDYYFININPNDRLGYVSNHSTNPIVKDFGHNYADYPAVFGIRILITLNPNLYVNNEAGNGSKENPWQLIE